MFRCGHDFIDFCESVRSEHRYVHTHAVHEFLEDLVASAAHRHFFIPYDSKLWRAQLNCDTEERESKVDADLTVCWPEDVPFKPERMKPKRNAAPEGRANAKGIPCLYVATDRDTAMAEVRSWIGAKLSVGRFRASKDLTVLNLAVNHDIPLTRDTLFKTSPDTFVRDAVWALVDKAFAKPVTNEDSTADYAPTQIIADMFSRHELDGLYYKSRVGSGYNLALFDLDSAELMESYLFSTARVSYEFKQEKYSPPVINEN
jgi:hypothetical protein